MNVGRPAADRYIELPCPLAKQIEQIGMGAVTKAMAGRGE
jgi:hypothetical protein